MKTILRPLLAASLLLALTFQLSAQDCGTAGRYSANIFAPQSVTKTSNIVYGRNAVRRYTNNTDSAAKNLLLDIYQPSDSDAADNRPLVILAFGGGFIGGDRSEIEPIARAYAQKGYVVAAIDYRIVTNNGDQFLLGPPPFSFTPNVRKQEIVNDAIVKASNDMRAAIRFFRHHVATGNSYRIDSAKIFIGGASAGAIAALHAAYIDADDAISLASLATAIANNGGVEGNTDLPGTPLIGTYSSGRVAGVINIAGALLDINVMDANDPPLYSAHGDNDDVIPFNSGAFSIQVPFAGAFIPVNLPIVFYGSGAIATKVSGLGLRNVLYTVPGGHEAPGTAPFIGNIINASADFAKVAVCGAESPLPVKLVSFTVKTNRCAAVFNWQTAMEENSSHFEIESSTDGVQFTKVASVSSRNASGGSAYNYQLDGAPKAGWFRLKMVDRNGSTAYSKAQRFNAACDDIQVQVYPNPAQHRATVAGLQTGMLVDVLTADGRLIWSQRAGGNTLELPVASFAKGLLLVRVKDEAGTLISSTKLMRN